jgi:putative peptidoglycan lipid II flippase
MLKLAVSATGISLLVLWLAGKGLAFGKDLLVSFYFGVSDATDAYFVASNVPGLIYAGLLATVPLVLLPHYSNHLVTGGIGRASRFASGALNCYLIAAVMLSILTYHFSVGLVGLLAPSLPLPTASLAASLTEIFAATFVFSMASAVLTTIQLAQRQVVGTQLIPIVNNGVFIFGLYLFYRHFGIYAAAISAAVAWLVQMPLQWFLVRRSFSYTLTGLPRNELYGLLGVFLPALLSLSLEHLNLLVTIYFGSGLSAGAISALSYAARLLSLFTGLFLVITTSIIYPEFSRNVAENEAAKATSSLDAVTKSVLLLAFPLAVIVATYSIDIVSLIFKRGAFDSNHVVITSAIVSVLAASIPFIALKDVYLRALYAFRSPNQAAIAGLAALAINVILSYTLLHSLETIGLAIAVVLSSLSSCVICYALLLRAMNVVLDGKLIRFCLKLVLLTTIILSVVLLIPLRDWGHSVIGRLALGGTLISCGFLGGYLALGFVRFDTKLRTIHRGY